MKIIEPSVENITPTKYDIESIYKHIELCGRTCYKSQDKITEDSYKKFCDNIKNNKHLSVFEHGTVYLFIKVNPYEVPSGLYNGWLTKCPIIDKYIQNPYSKVVDAGLDDNKNSDGSYHDLIGMNANGETQYCITTNMRVIIENGWEEDLKYLCEPTEYHEKRYTFRVICDRAVSHEWVRHRHLSFSQESQRYVSSCSKRNISEFNCDNIEDIILAYKQGFSMREIAENSSNSESAIYKILKDNNIKIRGLGNRGNRIEDYFNIIDTPEKAYLLGIIQTDGNTTVRSRNSSLSITQHKDYSWYIKIMLLEFSDNVTDSKDRECRQLQIGSKNIVNDLISIGIVPNKTKLQTDKDIDNLWESIPLKFKGDFIRGLIDGDGYVSFYTQKKGINESARIGFCSIKEHLINILIDFIYEKFNYKCGKYKDGNIYKLSISDYNKAIEIGTYLYTNFKYPFGHPKKTSAWIKRLQCNYPIAEYKDSKFILVKPHWLDNSNPDIIYNYIKCTNKQEDAYTSLRLKGVKPQDARAVLPNSCKTELIVTGFESDWRHFLSLRSNKAGATGQHPDINVLANQVYDYIKETN